MQNFIVTKNHAMDNIQFFKENSEADYCRCIQDLISKKPFGNNKFYIFSFVKRVDDNSGIKKMFHQPRLTKPEPLPGTTLLKVDPRDPGMATIIWTLPNQENFNLYASGKMFADAFVYECVQKYLKNPQEMCRKDPDDLPDEKIRELYREMKVRQQAKSVTKFSPVSSFS